MVGPDSPVSDTRNAPLIIRFESIWLFDLRCLLIVLISLLNEFLIIFHRSSPTYANSFDTIRILFLRLFRLRHSKMISISTKYSNDALLIVLNGFYRSLNYNIVIILEILC